jgi:hypothetical protein
MGLRKKSPKMIPTQGLSTLIPWKVVAKSIGFFCNFQKTPNVNNRQIYVLAKIRPILSPWSSRMPAEACHPLLTLANTSISLHENCQRRDGRFSIKKWTNK